MPHLFFARCGVRQRELTREPNAYTYLKSKDDFSYEGTDGWRDVMSIDSRRHQSLHFFLRMHAAHMRFPSYTPSNRALVYNSNATLRDCNRIRRSRLAAGSCRLV